MGICAQGTLRTREIQNFRVKVRSFPYRLFFLSLLLKWESEELGPSLAELKPEGKKKTYPPTTEWCSMDFCKPPPWLFGTASLSPGKYASVLPSIVQPLNISFRWAIDQCLYFSLLLFIEVSIGYSCKWKIRSKLSFHLVILSYSEYTASFLQTHKVFS